MKRLLLFTTILAGFCISVIAGDSLPENIRYEKLNPFSAWTFPDVLRLEVREKESGEPVGGATVRLKLASPEDGQPAFESEYETDAVGNVDIPLAEHRGKRFRSFSLEISAGSRIVPGGYLWSGVWSAAKADIYADLTQNAPVQIPSRLTAEMKKGVMLPLEFTDPEGKPVENAEIVAQIENCADFVVDGVRLPARTQPNIIRAKTDHAGKCPFGPVLKGDKRISVTVVHPDFRRFHVYVSEPPDSVNAVTGEPDPKRFRFMLDPPEKPFILEGRVLDEDGKPIAGAAFGESNFSDENGRYRTEINPQGSPRLSLQVFAHGMKRFTVELDATTLKMPFDITMRRGRTIRIRAVDEQGNPVPEIDAAPCILEVPELRGTVFQDGLWATGDAPEDEIFLSVRYVGKTKDGKTYCAENPFYVCRPREEPYTVKMLAMDTPAPVTEPVFHHSGTGMIPLSLTPATAEHSWKLPDRIAFRVRDFETGEPCEDVRVTVTFDVRTDVQPSIISASSRTPAGYGRVRFAEPEAKTDFRGVVGMDFTELDADAVLGLEFLFERKGYRPKRLKWRARDIGPYYGGIATPVWQLRRAGPPVPAFLDLLLVRETTSP